MTEKLIRSRIASMRSRAKQDSKYVPTREEIEALIETEALAQDIASAVVIIAFMGGVILLAWAMTTQGAGV